MRIPPSGTPSGRTACTLRPRSLRARAPEYRPRLVLGLTLVLVCCGFQDEEPSQRNTARVPEYPELDRLVNRASALAGQGRFAEALDIYEEGLRKHPRTLVPLPGGRAISVRDHVLGTIATWPPEAQALYRQRVDPQAEYLFLAAKRSQDIDALESLADRFPMSTHAAEALALAANLYLDAGEHERAAAALSRLLERDGGAAPQVTIARLGVAYARAGRRSALESLLRRVERNFASGKVQVAGQEVELASHLKALLAKTNEAKSLPALDLPAWEMIGGAPSGSKLAESGVELARLAWSDLVGLPRFEVDDEMGIRPGRGPGLSLDRDFRPLFPAVADGVLYVHNGVALTAYNLFARSPEKLWQFRVPQPQGEVMFDNRVIYASTVHEGRVFANLIAAAGSAEDQLGYVRVKFPFPRRALYCLDAATGVLLWKVGGVPRVEEVEKNASFAAPPTPDGGRLYSGAVRQKLNTDPFDHFVLCLEAATGKILWSTEVASGGTEINLFGNPTRESLGSPCAVAEDSVYYCTNHGVIAAVDKKTGRPKWTYQYRQLPVNPTRSVYVTKNRLEWVNSPPIVEQGIVAVTPTDSRFLYALDAKTGELRWERPRSRDVRSLFGARDGRLVLGGERIEILDLKTGESAGVPGGDELQGTGRGAVAADGLYVACRDKLRRLNWDGSWDEARSRSWPGGIIEGGNLVVVDGAVILSTQDTVQVYFDRRDQDKTIRAELAKDPENPVVLVRAALRFLQSGESDQAAGLLRKAIARTAGSARPEEEHLHRSAQKRLFALEMEAARHGAAEEAVPHLLAAREAAPDTPSRLEASIQIGRAKLQLGDDARAVAEFQKLLLENGDDVLNGARVFDLARNAIDALLKAAGRKAYAAQEQAASKLLAEARREGTPDAFLRVFRNYPNSESAEQALLLCARAQSRLERPDEEIATLRQALREYADSSRAPEIQAILVRALEKKGHFAGATVLLRRMARSTPDAEISEGEAKVRVRDWVEKRLKGEAYTRSAAAEKLSTLHPPLAKSFEHTDARLGAPLEILGVVPPGAGDLLFMRYPASVKAFDLKKRAEAWALSTSSLVQFAAFVEEGLVLADQEGVSRVDLATGKVEWRHGSPTRMHGFAVAGPFLFYLSPDPDNELVMRLSALDAAKGSVVWAQGFEGTAASDLFVAGDAVGLLTLDPHQIQLFESETGKRLLSEAGYTRVLNAQASLASDDLLLIQSEGRFLEGYDLPAGTLRWRIMLTRMSTRSIEAGAGEIAILGTQRSAGGAEGWAFLAVASMKTGKILRMQEKMDLGVPLSMVRDGDRSFVLSREADRSYSLRAVKLSDLTVEWKTTVAGKDAGYVRPAAAKDHLAVGFTERDNRGKFAYGACVLDKTGRVVQNIKSEFVFEHPPEFGLGNDRMVFSVDNKVEVHR